MSQKDRTADDPAKRQTPAHHKSEQEEKQEREENMDHTLADSFPASDPPSSIPDPEDQDSAA